MSWNDTTVACLVDGAANGRSVREIIGELEQLGYQFSRDMIIGKAHRMGLRLGCNMAWPPAAIECLQQMAANDATSGAITCELGRLGFTFSRKAVTDQARRRGIVLKKSKTGPAKATPSRSPHASTKAQLRQQRIAAAAEIAPLRLADAQPLSSSQPVKLIELKSNHCRWPLHRDQDGDRLFCGAPKTFGSYCVHHFLISLGHERKPAHEHHRANV